MQTCLHESNLPINVFCNQCLGSLFLNRFHFIAMVISIVSVGFLVSFYKVLWLLGAYGVLLIILYTSLTLHSERRAFLVSWLMMIISLPLIFLSLNSPLTFGYVNEIYIVLILLVVLASAIAYGAYWIDVCRERFVSFLEGLSAVSLTLFLISLLAVFLLNQFGTDYLNAQITFLQFQLPTQQAISYLTGSLDIRIVTLGLTTFLILVLALIELIRRPVLPRPGELFNPTTEIILVTSPTETSFVGAVHALMSVTLNVLLYFYKISTQILKVIVNTLSILVIWTFRYMVTYVTEVMSLVQLIILVFVNTNYRWFGRFLVPLALYVIIAVQVNILALDITEYILTGIGINPLNFAAQGALLFVLTVFLIWLLTGYEFIATLRSMIANNIPSGALLLLSIFIASIPLAVLPRWIESLTFRILSFNSIGTFTGFGILTMLVLGVGTFLYSFARNQRPLRQ